MAGGLNSDQTLLKVESMFSTIVKVFFRVMIRTGGLDKGFTGSMMQLLDAEGGRDKGDKGDNGDNSEKRWQEVGGSH